MKRYLIIHEDPDTGVQELITNELNDDALEIDANCKQEALDKFLDSNLVLIPMSEFKAVSATPYRNMKYIQELIGNGNVPDTI